MVGSNEIAMIRDNSRDGNITSLIRLDKIESGEKIYVRFFKNIIFNNDHKKFEQVFDGLRNSISLFVINSNPNLFSIPTTV
jgi:hypothetical protein